MKFLRSSSMRTASGEEAPKSLGISISSLPPLVNNTTGLSLEYDEYDNQEQPGEYVYKINTQTGKQLTLPDLLKILDINNIGYKTGVWYDVYTKSQLEIESSSIILKKCVDVGCDLYGFRFFLVGNYLVSRVRIKTQIFPDGVDPKKINSITFL